MRSGADTMSLMAKHKVEEPAPEPRRPNRTGVPLHVYIPPDIREALDAMAEDNRRPLTSEVLIALEAHLKAAGRMPQRPKPGGKEGS